MINFILDSLQITSILALSLGIVSIGYSSSETPVSQSTPVAQVAPLTAEVEIEFVPDATVSIIEDEIEIDFIAQ